MKFSEMFTSIQGEGRLAGVPSNFIRLSTCDLRCWWCSVASTQILMSDLTWKPIGDIEIGDSVVGMDNSGFGKHFKLTPSTVLDKFERISPTRRLILENGIEFQCSADHPIYKTNSFVKTPRAHVGWMRAQYLKQDNGIRYSIRPENVSFGQEYWRGWLCGLFDGDGTYWALKKDKKCYYRCRLVLQDSDIISLVDEKIQQFGFPCYIAPVKGTGFSNYCYDGVYITKSNDAQRFEQWLHMRSKKDQDEYMRGWLAGFFDAEGTWSGLVRFYQQKGRFRKICFSYAKQLGFGPVYEKDAIRLDGSTDNSLRFFSICRPQMRRKWKFWDKALKTRQRVIANESSDTTTVISLKTETGNYFTDGIFSHNCDTPYTSWNPERLEMTTLEIAEAYKKLKPLNHVVITGGEPMLWKKENDLPSLTYHLQRVFGCHVTIETNGRHFIENLFCDLMSISPKLKSSTPLDDDKWRVKHERIRINDRTIYQLMREYDYQLKFVVDVPDDLKEAVELVKELQADVSKVYLMPQARTVEELQAKQQWVVEMCIENGFNYSPRIHIEIWGNRRGV